MEYVKKPEKDVLLGKKKEDLVCNVNPDSGINKNYFYIEI